MIDKKKALIAKEWISKLANGINPINESTLKEDDIVNNVHISRCLFYVSDLIDVAIKKSDKKSKEYELDFSLTDEEINKVFIAEKTGIAAFVREINRVIPDNMKPISTTLVLNWLLVNDYMKDVIREDGRKTRQPTLSGNSIGISTEMKDSSKGPYMAVIYDSNAQQFILNNIMSITKQ